MLQYLAQKLPMSLFRSLLLVIAGSTQRELARQVRYLKVENEILRSKLPARIAITPKERRRLVKFGTGLGRALHQLVSIVTPGTFLRWIREEKRASKRPTKSAKRGRPRTAEEIRRLIVKLARENAWGYLTSGEPVPRFDEAVKYFGEQMGFATIRAESLVS